MISRFGHDTSGENTLGVSMLLVHVTDEAFSGVAPTAFDPEGNSSVVTRSVLRPGTQTTFPDREELADILGTGP